MGEAFSLPPSPCAPRVARVGADPSARADSRPSPVIAAGVRPARQHRGVGAVRTARAVLPPLFTGAGTDVRTVGCVADGVTNQTACINNALSTFPDCVIIPASANGFTVNGVLNVKKCLRGTLWSPNNNALGFAGSSVIKCNNQAAQNCVAVNNWDITQPRLRTSLSPDQERPQLRDRPACNGWAA